MLNKHLQLPTHSVNLNKSNWADLPISKYIIRYCVHNIKSICSDLFFSSLKAAYLPNSVLISIAPSDHSQMVIKSNIQGEILCISTLTPHKSKEGKIKGCRHAAGSKKGDDVVCLQGEDRNVKKLGRWEKDYQVWKGWLEVRDMEGEKMMWEIKVWEMSMWRGGGRWWGSPNPETPSNMASPALYYQICHHGKEHALRFIFYRLTFEAIVVEMQLFSSCSRGCTSYPFRLQPEKDLVSK